MGQFKPRVNGPFGLVTGDQGVPRMVSLSFPNGVPDAPTVGQYKIGMGPWMPIPLGGLSLPLGSNDTLELKASHFNLDDTHCEMLNNTSTNATFKFNWDDPNWPGLTIEAKELPVMDDPIGT